MNINAEKLREYANRETGYIYADEVEVLRAAADQIDRLHEGLQEARDYIADDDPGEADTGGFHSALVTRLDRALHQDPVMNTMTPTRSLDLTTREIQALYDVATDKIELCDEHNIEIEPALLSAHLALSRAIDVHHMAEMNRFSGEGLS